MLANLYLVILTSIPQRFIPLKKHVSFLSITETRNTFIGHDLYCSVRHHLMLPYDLKTFDSCYFISSCPRLRKHERLITRFDTALTGCWSASSPVYLVVVSDVTDVKCQRLDNKLLSRFYSQQQASKFSTTIVT